MHFFNRFIGIGCFLMCLQMAWADLRDPTRPENVDMLSLTSEMPSTELQAIIISKDQRTVIINGRSFQEGDTMDNFKITAIYPNAVHLSGPNGKMTLFLFNQTVKKQVWNDIKKDF